MKKHVQNPTYLLAPNWTYRYPGGIALGNIVADPFKPHVVLSRADPDPSRLPAVEKATERNWRLSSGRDHNITVGVWASFLQLVGLDVGGNTSRAESTEYSTDVLETFFFRDGISPADIADRVQEPVVAALLKPGSVLSKPVYMISGLKVARHFRLNSEGTSRHGGNVEATAPLDGTGAVTGGGKVGVEVGASGGHGFEADDVVFAYQVHKIAPKGWSKSKAHVRVTEFQPSAAFLGDDDSDEVEVEGQTTVEVEDSPFSAADVSELAAPTRVEHEKLDAEGQEIIVLSLKAANAVNAPTQ